MTNAEAEAEAEAACILFRLFWLLLLRFGAGLSERQADIDCCLFRAVTDKRVSAVHSDMRNKACRHATLEVGAVPVFGWELLADEQHGGQRVEARELGQDQHQRRAVARARHREEQLCGGNKC